jgi:hypothetical protein
MALAGDEKGCSEAVRKACPHAKAEAGCDSHKAAGVQKVSVEESRESTEESHVCPDVKDRAALQGFHESMHPMHMALSSSDYDDVRAGLPNLLKASEAIEQYKCKGYENCPRDERKAFDQNKKVLIQAIKDLKEACKGDNNEKVTASFDKMHEAYISFANACSH